MSATKTPSPRVTVLPDNSVSLSNLTNPQGSTDGPPEQKMNAEKSLPTPLTASKSNEPGPPSLEADSHSHSISAAVSISSGTQLPHEDIASPKSKPSQEEPVDEVKVQQESCSKINSKLKSAQQNDVVEEIIQNPFSSESEIVQTIPSSPISEGASERIKENYLLEAAVAEQWWPAYRWENPAGGNEDVGMLRVDSTEGRDERQLLRPPLEPFFVLKLPSPKTNLNSFPSLKSKDSRVWDAQLLRRMQHLFPSLHDSLEVWLTSDPEWRLLASVLFFMATCKSWSQSQGQAKNFTSEDIKEEQRIAYFCECLGLEKKIFTEQIKTTTREILEDGMKGEAFFHTTVLELGSKDAGWSSRIGEAVGRRYKVRFTSPTQKAEVLAFLRVAMSGFHFVQNPLTAAHEALAYHPALACLRAVVPRPKVFPRASAKAALGCVEWFVDSDSGLLVLYSNQRLEQHARLYWSSSRFLPFDDLNARWTSSLASKVDDVEAGQTPERQLLPLTLLFQTCRLSVFKPYHALDQFINDPTEHAFSEQTVQQLVQYGLDPQNMDLLRCKVPSLGTEIVQESLFASLYLRCCLFACFAVWVHRKGVNSALTEMLRHHPAFAPRWAQTGRETKSEVLRVFSKKRAVVGDGGSGRRHRHVSRQKNGAPGPGAEFLADALLFALEDQFTELCFLLFPPQGSYLSDQLGNDVLLKFASLAQKCHLLRKQRLPGRSGISREECKDMASGSGDKYLFLVEIRENLLVKSSNESETGVSEEERVASTITRGKQKMFVRWGV